MTVTKTYTYTGSTATLTIPAGGVVGGKIHVKLWGASTVASRDGTVAGGGYVEGDLTVAAGDVLTVFIGGNNGFNGGGNNGTGLSGTGAGATDIRKGGTTLANRVAVAAGAGAFGGGYLGNAPSRGGAGGSATGAAGTNTTGAPTGGGGGTQSAGGAAGTPFNGFVAVATAGALGVGGAGGYDGTRAQPAGGGGGGGYYGGGGGGGGNNEGMGGGGGSNYVGGLTGTVTNSQGVAGPTTDGKIIITYTVVPNAPTLNTPVDTSTLDGTVSQRFTWTASSGDPSDAQSKYDLRYSSNGGTTWTTVTATTPNQYRDFAAGTFTSGTYQWQVRTYNAAGSAGAWSTSGHFTVGTPAAGPTITYPTSGGTVDGVDRVDWSFTGQQAYQVQRVADDSGSMADPGDPANIYYDSGQVTDTTTRSLPLTFPVNSRYEWIRVTVESGGLWTAWTAERVDVSYDPPDVPTATITTDAGNARMWVDYDDTGGSSPGEYVNVYWSRDGGATVESSDLMLPPTGTSVFWTPASGVDYVVQVQAVAANGVTASTDWIGATTVVIDGGTGGPVDLVLDGGTP